VGGRLTPLGSFDSPLSNSGQFAAIGNNSISFSGASTNAAAGTISLIGSTLNLGSGAQKLTNSGRINLIDSAVNGDINSLSGGVINTAGNVTFNGNITGGGGTLLVSDGLTTISPSGTLVADVASLTITTGSLDLTNNKLILTASPVGSWNGSAYTDVTGQIASGRNGGPLPLWDGSGIVTSQSNATGGNFTSIGVARASDVRPATATATTLWAGQTITGTDTLVMYTYGGDATLDGKINIDDYVKIDTGIASGLTGWVNGDFNYDGKVNIDDYTTVIDANIGNQSGVFPTSASATLDVTSVPEPLAGGVGVMLMMPWALRRRRDRGGRRIRGSSSQEEGRAGSSRRGRSDPGTPG
jgi:hypothetical protein